MGVGGLPTVTLIGGPNGSGKSTLIRHLIACGANFGVHLNADVIAKDLTGSNPNRIAQELVRAQRSELMNAGVSYSWETVMSHESHIEHLAQARARGYEINVIYVCIDDPVVNAYRVEERVENGGHSVPPDKIIERYHKSIRNLSAAIIISHHARIFDNGMAFEPMRPVASWDGIHLDVAMNPPPRWFAPALADLADFTKPPGTSVR